MSIPQISVVLNWRNDQNKSGLYSVHLRITIDRISLYAKISLPQKVRETEWTGIDGQWVKTSHAFSFEINNKIIERKNIVDDLIKRCYNFNKRVTFEMIFVHLNKKGDRHSFYDYMDSGLFAYEREGHVSSSHVA